LSIPHRGYKGLTAKERQVITPNPCPISLSGYSLLCLTDNNGTMKQHPRHTKQLLKMVEIEHFISQTAKRTPNLYHDSTQITQQSSPGPEPNLFPGNTVHNNPAATDPAKKCSTSAHASFPRHRNSTPPAAGSYNHVGGCSHEAW
jgi:hypothetical protein